MWWILWGILILFGLALLFGVLLAITSKYLDIKEDKRVEGINKLLPGYNCGVCNFPGCLAFAKAIVNEDVTNLKLCKPAKKDKHYYEIVEFLNNNPCDDGRIIKIEFK